MLSCHDTTILLDDFLDRRLAPERALALGAHLQGCERCRALHAGAEALQKALRELAAPAPRAGFVAAALARAAAPAAARRRRTLGAFALAATLVLGLALGMLVQRAEPPAPTVVLKLEQRETVRLNLASAQPLQAATLTLDLPENLELVGYGALRRLTWQADLRAGDNLLALPLVAHGLVDGRLRAEVSHGGSSRTLYVKIDVQAKGGML